MLTSGKLQLNKGNVVKYGTWRHDQENTNQIEYDSG